MAWRPRGAPALLTRRRQAKHPAFAPFFTARWHRILRASLKSLLSAMVAKAPLPQLLTLDLYRLRSRAFVRAVRRCGTR